MKAGRGFVVRDLPWTEAKLCTIPPFEFENWAVIALAESRTKRRSATWASTAAFTPSLPAPRRASPARANSPARTLVSHPGKADGQTSRLDIDAFEAMMMRENCDTGFFVSFAYSSDAMTEIGQFFKRTGKMIHAFTVRDIPYEEIVRKLV